MPSYEYRIFFPLTAPSTASASTAAAAAAAASDFSLYTLTDWLVFQSSHTSAPATPKESAVEERTDVYLIDTHWKHTNNYGLKLRHASSHFSLTPTTTESSYQLELKVRKEPFLDGIIVSASTAAAAAAGVAASSSSSSSSSSSTLPTPEEWKKVLSRAIYCTPSTLIRNILTEVELVLRATSTDKKRILRLMTEFTKEVQAKRDAELAATATATAASAATSSSSSATKSSSAASAWTFVSVKKRRTKLSKYDAEQTDIEIHVLNDDSSSSTSSSSPPASSSPRPLRFRSICFESSNISKLRTPPITGLFTHIMQRYPNAAMVAGYPEFIAKAIQMGHSDNAASTEKAEPDKKSAHL